MEVDTGAVIASRLESIESQAKSDLRKERLRYRSVVLTQDNQLIASFADEDVRDRAARLLCITLRSYCSKMTQVMTCIQ